VCAITYKGGVVFMGSRLRGLAICVDQTVNEFTVQPDVTLWNLISRMRVVNLSQNILMCEKWRNVIAQAHCDTSQYYRDVIYVRRFYTYYNIIGILVISVLNYVINDYLSSRNIFLITCTFSAV
jgi:hypothetical protein